MFDKTITTMAAFLLSGISTSACLTDSNDETLTSQPPATVDRTIVHLNSDGSYDQAFETVTMTQHQAEINARLALMKDSRTGVRPQNIIAVDSGCGGNSLWLFDQPNMQGHMFCLFLKDASGGSLDLGRFCRERTCSLGSWSDAVRSLWAGVDSGSLVACTPFLCYAGFNDGFGFDPFEAFDNVSHGSHPLNTIVLFAP